MKFADMTEREQLAVRKENIIHLPLGLLGFERIKRYVLLSNPEEAPFLWLQVLDEPDLAFLVISPTVVAPEYQPELSDEDVAFLNLQKPQDALIFNIVTVRGAGQATVNLKGPVVLNRHTLIGKQIVPLNAAEFAVQFPLNVTE
ncbi:MAG: flagellar assembly protein FliW [Verrucomicrobiota bacterium]